jgi:glycosyltransferase involved in cell wall biosynthesis
VRGSSHIRAQAQILEEESQRTSTRIDRPTTWMIDREEREYELATRVVTTSSFVYRTFREQGVPADRLVKIPMGVNVNAFRAPVAVVEERVSRILRGDPLRVLFVGALSMRKGSWDMLPIMSALPSSRFVFRCIGPVGPDMAELLPKLRQYAEVMPKQPHHELPRWYSQSDLFLFPTIEDGFPAVLSQAQASALPTLTTPNCSGPDIISDGANGWILPIRSPESFVERLLWCDAHRKEVAGMVRAMYTDFQPRSFDDAARDLEEFVQGMAPVISEKR